MPLGPETNPFASLMMTKEWSDLVKADQLWMQQDWETRAKLAKINPTSALADLNCPTPPTHLDRPDFQIKSS
jgi:hypothetical protein